jgi:hypothetical protein
MAKAVVRSARREDRYPLWERLQAGLSGARQEAVESGDAWPWQPPSETAHISWESLQDVLASAIRATAEEIPERQRLVRAAAESYADLITKGTGKTLRTTKYGIKRCARCGTRFAARSRTHAYCSGTCRTAAYEARQRANEQAGADVSMAAS